MKYLFMIVLIVLGVLELVIKGLFTLLCVASIVGLLLFIDGAPQLLQGIFCFDIVQQMINLEKADQKELQKLRRDHAELQELMLKNI